MNYKLSQFNIVIPLETSDDIILFNTKECSFVVLDKNTQSFLHDVETISTYTEETVNNLLELGFIIPENINEVELFTQETQNTRLANKDLSITIATTLDCNLNCYYCFVQKDQIYLSMEKTDEIINFIIKQLQEGSFEKILLTWTGGEPLLNQDVIEYISKVIVNYCADHEIEYHGSIITNGILLTESTAKFLHEMKVRDAQVTLDGLEKTHNRRRVSLAGINGFETIIHNINLASQYLNINIRINVDQQNKDDIPVLLQHLYNTLNYQANSRISVSISKVEGATSSLSTDNFYNFLRDIYDDYMIDSEIEKNYPTPLRFACGAQCKHSYVIDPDGDVYRCWEEVGIKECSIGTVHRINDQSPQNLKYLHDLWPEDCKSCAYLPICHGGCPMRRFENNNQPMCTSITKVLTQYLKKYYIHWLENSVNE